MTNSPLVLLFAFLKSGLECTSQCQGSGTEHHAVTELGGNSAIAQQNDHKQGVLYYTQSGPSCVLCLVMDFRINSFESKRTLLLCRVILSRFRRGRLQGLSCQSGPCHHAAELDDVSGEFLPGNVYIYFTQPTYLTSHTRVLLIGLAVLHPPIKYLNVKSLRRSHLSNYI